MAKDLREEKGEDLGKDLNRERGENIVGRKREKLRGRKGLRGGKGEWISTGKGGKRS